MISTATIQHVGSNENQERMIKNIIGLSKKYFIITTPNLYHPIEFHTKLPFLHWLPKKYTDLYCLFLILNFFLRKKTLILLREKRFVDILKKLILKIMK